jgi:hypothetical protein
MEYEINKVSQFLKPEKRENQNFLGMFHFNAKVGYTFETHRNIDFGKHIGT